MSHLITIFLDLMHRGGFVMWLLLIMSMTALTIVIERFWFWARTNSAGELARLAELTRLLRQGDEAGARALARADQTIYGKIASKMLDDRADEVTGTAIVEMHRPALERFMPTLNSLITGAPLLGLIGTVVGLITTFQFMSDKMMAVDPRNVGVGLASALLNTAGGLIIALGTLFPYNYFRAQIDHTLGRLESLIAAAASLDPRNRPTEPAGRRPGSPKEGAGQPAAPDRPL